MAALLAIRCALSLHAIGLPGIQQDETLFVNAATLRIPGLYIFHQILGIPVMVFPYIGALKSWLYDPVFAVFGTSATTIRLPAALIATAGLVLAYVAVRDLINRQVALVAFGFLCFDNSLFWLTRNDVGPSALEFFFKCAAFFFAARLARAPRVRWLILVLVNLFLGMFNVLNFIWFINAAALVSVLLLLCHRDTIRVHLRLWIIWAAGLAVLYGSFAAYYFAEHIGRIGPTVHGSLLSYTWPRFAAGTREILSGTWFYGYALGPLRSRDIVVAIVLILFVAGGVASVAWSRTRSLAVACLAIVTLVIAVQNVITRQATAGWHYLSIYPFVTIVAAYGLYVLARAVLRRGVAVGVVLGGVVLLSLVYNGTLMAKYFRALSREPANVAWSPSVYRLSRVLQFTNARVFTADWGVFNPLFALHPTRRYTELAFALQTSDPAYLAGLSRWFSSLSDDKLFITHADSKLVFPRANANLFTATGHHLKLLETMPGRDGSPVYRIYLYR
jgi:4-amino-4-deoxy-L-arabinose transferase-like glycosyltransferase